MGDRGIYLCGGHGIFPFVSGGTFSDRCGLRGDPWNGTGENRDQNIFDKISERNLIYKNMTIIFLNKLKFEKKGVNALQKSEGCIRIRA